MNKICSKSTTKAQEQHKSCCSGVFIVNFRDVSVEEPVKHVRWSFCNSRDKSKKFELGSKYTSETLNRFYLD